MTAAISTETMTDSTPATVTAPKDRRQQPPQHHDDRTSVCTEASGKLDPTAHLSAADVEALARELDALRQEVLGSRGTKDAAYIRKVIDVQRKLGLGSRAVLLFSLFPPAWLVGTAGLAVAKILENMEIGHNVMHGQWDWMRDPKITQQPGSGTTHPRPICGSAHTTSCTTPTPTCSAATTTWASASCGLTRTSGGDRCA